jgi:putative acetyltransferase
MALRQADPLAPELRPLILRHLAEMQAASPPGSSHALAPEALAEPGVAFFALEEAGRVLAFGALKPLEPGHGELKSMHVLDTARGRGLGRSLLSGLIARAEAAGMARLSLETGHPPAYGAAVALYRAAGFVECPPFADYRPDPASLFLTRPPR